MEFREFGKIARLSREMVITEKIDGTNGLVAIEEGTSLKNGGLVDANFEGVDYVISAGSRTRWITPEKDNAGFARWVIENANELVKLGTGFHYGEWWGQGIQRNYGLKEKRFSLFNSYLWSDELGNRPSCCHVVPVLYSGMFDTRVIRNVLDDLKHTGSHASKGFMKPEGVVIYHTAGNLYFKKTIEGDEKPKSLASE
ncbi:MAG TPA: RNA ligase family protein [Williamwhitmania sp.]|nr:RNA ligase family protein [Williamwhitmania sp.]